MASEIGLMGEFYCWRLSHVPAQVNRIGPDKIQHSCQPTSTCHKGFDGQQMGFYAIQALGLVVSQSRYSCHQIDVSPRCSASRAAKSCAARSPVPGISKQISSPDNSGCLPAQEHTLEYAAGDC